MTTAALAVPVIGLGLVGAAPLSAAVAAPITFVLTASNGIGAPATVKVELEVH